MADDESSSQQQLALSGMIELVVRCMRKAVIIWSKAKITVFLNQKIQMSQ